MCVWWQSAVSCHPISVLKKIDFFSELCEKIKIKNTIAEIQITLFQHQTQKTNRWSENSLLKGEPLRDSRCQQGTNRSVCIYVVTDQHWTVKGCSRMLCFTVLFYKRPKILLPLTLKRQYNLISFCTFLLDVSHFRSQHLYINKRKVERYRLWNMHNVLSSADGHIYIIRDVENTILEHCIY